MLIISVPPLRSLSASVERLRQVHDGRSDAHRLYTLVPQPGNRLGKHHHWMLLHLVLATTVCPLSPQM